MGADARSDLQQLINSTRDFSDDEKGAWMQKLRRETPDVADEVERLMNAARSHNAAEYQRSQLVQALAGKYTLGDEVGRGGMATVYRARDQRHGRDVAVKVIPPDTAAGFGAERFLAEIRLTANMLHPNILPLLDSGESGGVLYYVMPFVEGETLRARMMRVGPMRIDEVVRILRAVIEALAYAHSKGAVHRDIKPDNILLAGRQTWVADFGIAKAMAVSVTSPHAMTTVGMAIGSPGYMAPEQIEGAGQIDHRADIYSVGVMAWEMLAGRPVFSGTTMQQLFVQHLTAAPQHIEEVRSDVPLALASTVMTCLAKSPDERWATAEALLEHLETVPTLDAAKSVQGNARLYRRVALGAALATTAVVGWLVSSNKSAPSLAPPRRVTMLSDLSRRACLPMENLLFFAAPMPMLCGCRVLTAEPRGCCRIRRPEFWCGGTTARGPSSNGEGHCAPFSYPTE